MEGLENGLSYDQAGELARTRWCFPAEEGEPGYPDRAKTRFNGPENTQASE